MSKKINSYFLPMTREQLEMKSLKETQDSRAFNEANKRRVDEIEVISSLVTTIINNRDLEQADET